MLRDERPESFVVEQSDEHEEGVGLLDAFEGDGFVLGHPKKRAGGWSQDGDASIASDRQSAELGEFTQRRNPWGRLRKERLEGGGDARIGGQTQNPWEKPSGGSA